MPVDYFAILFPFAFSLAVIVALISSKYRRQAGRTAILILVSFIAIYFVPGWIAMVGAHNGDATAQYRLANWYWTRVGYMWSDLDARDRWLVEAATNGHAEAMQDVGYFSIWGTSHHIPRDFEAARMWLTRAEAAGAHDVAASLKVLAKQETRMTR